MKRMKHPTIVLALALWTVLLLTGCKSGPTVDGVLWAVENHYPGVVLERETHIRIGRFPLAILKRIARWASDEDEDDLRILRSIRRLEVASYRVHALPAEAELGSLRRLEHGLAKHGWQTMIRTREDDEQTWILYREDEAGAIRHLYIVALEPHELTVVNLEGRIDHLMAEAMADEPGELIEFFGP